MLKVYDFKKMKEQNETIVMITAYDYYSAKLCESCNIDIILVGDSLGMVVYGENDTLHVSIQDIIRHCKAVRNGALQTFIVADMPYMSYHLSVNETKKNASALILEGKADAVKIEGGTDSRIQAIKAIIDCEIPVVAHLGLTPQSIHKFGGFKVQGKYKEQQDLLIQQSLEIENAGAFMLVLEGIPEELGQKISSKLAIPTIGIGAGRYTDGQVLVWHDIMGLTDIHTKFSKSWCDGKSVFTHSINNYKQDVKNKVFPAKENIYYPKEERTEK
jgi:3-methyl-2-oxobutanoate hydroxymethyltransferase